MAHFCGWQVMLAISWELSGAVDSSGTAVFGLSKWLELLTAGRLAFRKGAFPEPVCPRWEIELA